MELCFCGSDQDFVNLWMFIPEFFTLNILSANRYKFSIKLNRDLLDSEWFEINSTPVNKIRLKFKMFVSMLAMSVMRVTTIYARDGWHCSVSRYIKAKLPIPRGQYSFLPFLRKFTTCRSLCNIESGEYLLYLCSTFLISNPLKILQIMFGHKFLCLDVFYSVTMQSLANIPKFVNVFEIECRSLYNMCLLDA